MATLGAAAIFQMQRKHRIGTFIGQLAPSFLTLGLYNKIVKVAGSDRPTAEPSLKTNQPAADSLH